MTQEQKVLNALKKEQVVTSNEIQAICRFKDKATASAGLHALELKGKAVVVGSFKPDKYRVLVYRYYQYETPVKQNIKEGTVLIGKKVYEVHGSWKLGNRLPVYDVLSQTRKRRDLEAQFLRANIKFGAQADIRDKKFFAMTVLCRRVLQGKIPKEKVKVIINSIKKGRTYEAYR